MRTINWARLRKKANAEKKLAITVFSFPPDKGNVGTAAYLNVFGSIYKWVADTLGLNVEGHAEWHGGCGGRIARWTETEVCCVGSRV